MNTLLFLMLAGGDGGVVSSVVRSRGRRTSTRPRSRGGTGRMASALYFIYLLGEGRPEFPRRVRWASIRWHPRARRWAGVHWHLPVQEKSC